MQDCALLRLLHPDVNNVSNVSGKLLRPSWEFTVANKTFSWPSSREEKPSRQRCKTH